MVLVVGLDNCIGVEVIFTTNGHASISGPLHILSLSSIVFVIVAQTQYQFHPIFSCLRYHKIKPLNNSQL